MSNEQTLVERLPDLIDRYWDIAYAEGNEGRTTDTPNGDAQDTRRAIDDALASQAVQITELQAEVERLRGALTTCENMHLPEATSEAVLGHMRCLEAFATMSGRALTAEAQITDLKRALDTARKDALEEAAKLIERDEFDAGVRLDPHRHKSISDWFREQQASAIRALSASPLSQGGQDG